MKKYTANQRKEHNT